MALAAAGCSGDEPPSELDALPTTAAPATASPSPSVDEQIRPTFEGTEREWLYALADCVEEGGFAVLIDEDEGSLAAANLPSEQTDAWNSHTEKCMMEVGEIRREELSEDQVRALFKDYLAAADCLENLGYEISDPPSRESWVKSWYTGINWLPHGEAGRAAETPAEWERIQEECPQPD